MSATVVADTPELVGLIIEQLQIVERPNTSTLAACMRVNSVFHQETARCLWDTLKDMRGIYMLLPPDVVGHLVSDHSPELIPGPLPPSIWQRLERYSGFVKELSISTNADVKLLTFLMERCLDHPLFPNITSLTLATACDDQIVRSLLHPGLRKLELRLGFKPQASLLDALRTTRLTDLGLKRYNAFNHWLDLDVLSSAIQQNLKSLRLRYFWLSEAHLFLIDSISEIEHLYITMFAFKSTGQGRIVSSQVLLPKLSSLYLRATARDYNIVARDFGIQPHDSLTVHHFDRIMSFSKFKQGMTEILDSLNDFRAFSLKSYGLRGSHGYFPNLDDGREYVFPASVIRPLLKFTLLEDLNLDLSPPIDFVDEDIESIIKALPHLIRVAIGVTNNRAFQCWGTRLTPSCLSLFATFARKLRYLSISVGAQWLELINAGFSSTSTSKLSSLQLNHSQIFPDVQEVEKIVSTLRTLFPHLREVGFKFEADEGQDISSEENGARRWIQEAFRGRGG